ncbi:helix-turn-helix domain-containing protein [Saccharomonospora sp. NPDC006951]
MTVVERDVEVPPELRSWFDAIRIATVDHGELTVVDEPDHATTLVLRMVPGLRGELVVMGPRTRAGYHDGLPGPACVRARITTGKVRQVLGRPARELVDQVVPLTAFWGDAADRLAGEFAGLRPGVAGKQLADRLGGELPSIVRADPNRGRLVPAAVAMLTASDGTGVRGVAEAARHLHISERQLRNVFLDDVGLAPKQFTRIARVRKVLSHAPARPLAELAAEAGYYDQAHLTGEFRRLMGVSPAAFRRGQRPSVATCGPRNPHRHGGG